MDVSTARRERLVGRNLSVASGTKPDGVAGVGEPGRPRRQSHAARLRAPPRRLLLQRAPTLLPGDLVLQVKGELGRCIGPGGDRRARGRRQRARPNRDCWRRGGIRWPS
eukprot:8137718-Alexandrium_andersonii.AAC.1